MLGNSAKLADDHGITGGTMNFLIVVFSEKSTPSGAQISKHMIQNTIFEVNGWENLPKVSPVMEVLHFGAKITTFDPFTDLEFL